MHATATPMEAQDSISLVKDEMKEQKAILASTTKATEPAVAVAAYSSPGKHDTTDSGTKPYDAQPKAAATSIAVSNKKRKKSSSSTSAGTTGRWTPAEHQAFLRGLSLYGREWKRVAADIPARSSAQVRSHAQKYFTKLAKQQVVGAWMMMKPIPVEQAEAAPESVRRETERILADPSSVQDEVRDTLRRLRERYQQLQRRLHDREGHDELIAVDVLQGGLRRAVVEREEEI